MRPLALLALLAPLLAGCGSSSDATAEAPPKGPPPNTVQAPPGTLTPEQRASQGATSLDQDPGGDHGK